MNTLNTDEIAKQLGISRRTVFNWMKQFDWKKPPLKPLRLHELQDVASAMLNDLYKNPDKYNNRTANGMYKFFKYVIDEEQKQAKRKKENLPPKGLTPEAICQIERDILGLHIS